MSSSSRNASKTRIFIGDDTNEHNNTVSDLNQTVIVNDINKDSCTYDTLDTLPNIDHYRNLFSFTSSEPKTRPTLEELHGTASTQSKSKIVSPIDLNSDVFGSIVISNESPLQTEVKPKVDIVKLGWIVGVLV